MCDPIREKLMTDSSVTRLYNYDYVMFLCS